MSDRKDNGLFARIRAEGDYKPLKEAPETPPQEIPTKVDCQDYEYMFMDQLCDIAEAHSLGRSVACNAFGGDRGKFDVIAVRMARATFVGNKLRKYVLVSAVEDYFQENGINW